MRLRLRFACRSEKCHTCRDDPMFFFGFGFKSYIAIYDRTVSNRCVCEIVLDNIRWKIDTNLSRYNREHHVVCSPAEICCQRAGSCPSHAL